MLIPIMAVTGMVITVLVFIAFLIATCAAVDDLRSQETMWRDGGEF